MIDPPASLDPDAIPAAAWLCLAVGDDRQFAGNDGYADDPSRSYHWDDRVPNHAKLQPGHVLLLWDKKGSLGVSVIEDISTATAAKALYRCPLCGKASIKVRHDLTPRYRCQACQGTFENANVEEVQVTAYRTSHEAGWVDLTGRLGPSQLRQLAKKPRSQHAMREMDVAALVRVLPDLFGGQRLGGLASSVARVKGGHVNRTVRVRVGQQSFRRHLLDRYGAACAFTGPAPTEVLDAAHLYSYAQSGEHHEDGGLLLRRDLHRLFDLGLIAVHPESLRLDVSDALARYDAYSHLDGTSVKVSLTKSQSRWVGDHWLQHRS